MKIIYGITKIEIEFESDDNPNDVKYIKTSIGANLALLKSLNEIRKRVEESK